MCFSVCGSLDLFCWTLGSGPSTLGRAWCRDQLARRMGSFDLGQSLWHQISLQGILRFFHVCTRHLCFPVHRGIHSCINSNSSGKGEKIVVGHVLITSLHGGVGSIYKHGPCTPWCEPHTSTHACHLLHLYIFGQPTTTTCGV